MSVQADEIWAILHGLAKSHEEFKAEQKVLQREIKEVNKSIGRLTNRLGQFVEEAVRPSAVKLFRERGIDVHEVHQNVTSKRAGEAVCLCGDVVL